ncbi:site-2 protease family protein [Paenibacillus agri]|uniref:M50 family metallopeptidase n=1 Tax=Paenibacillus agri TaxID=2744309 RepID=A0A850EHG4_9BACL|nr:site-2 protease family protein [Paenibacillus agri]NUU59119.1 M50 family metallopeptidase [Paenibacillus agri]
MIGIIFSVFLLAVLVHESGHLLVGLGAGLHPKEMIVGPFRLLFTRHSLSLRPNHSWLHFGGTMRFAPGNDNLEKMAFKWSLMSLGGPIASLLTALLILIFPHFWSFWTESLMGISIALGAATLIPLSNGPSHSDGQLFLLLHKKSDRAKLLMAGVILQKDYLSERRPSEWNPGIITATVRLLESLPERTQEQLAEETELRMYLYCHFADKEQPDQALKYIRPIILTQHPSASISASRIMIDSSYASHLLLHPLYGAQSRQEAEVLVKSLSKREPYSYHKAWAAMLSVQGKKTEAAEHLHQAKLLLDRWFKPFGTYRLEQTILSEIENRL